MVTALRAESIIYADVFNILRLDHSLQALPLLKRFTCFCEADRRLQYFLRSTYYGLHVSTYYDLSTYYDYTDPKMHSNSDNLVMVCVLLIIRANKVNSH